MKKIFYVTIVLLLLTITTLLLSCDEYFYDDYYSESDDDSNNLTNNNSKIELTIDKSEALGLEYSEVEKLFRDMGFSKFEYKKTESNDETKKNNAVYDIEIEQIWTSSEFSKGDLFKANSTIIIWYYEVIPNLTVDNCDDLAALLLIKDPEDSSVKDFSSKYKGQIIEFDGCVHAIQNHKNYSTRYDILIGAGEYNSNSITGPNFHFTNVNALDLGLNTLYLEDELYIGCNIHIIAEVKGYDYKTTLFELSVEKIEIIDD